MHALLLLQQIIYRTRLDMDRELERDELDVDKRVGLLLSFIAF